MSVQDIEVGLLHIPNPNSSTSLGWTSIDGGPSYIISYNIRTLSSRGAERGGIVRGLLYVPAIAQSDPCFNLSRSYFPANASQSLIPNSLGWTYVGIAPWISPACNLIFLDGARLQNSKAFIFYLPDNGTTLPSSTDPFWDFGDGGHWMTITNFPVYAIPSSSGQVWMDQISLYSGDLASDPSVILPFVPGVPSTDFLRFEANIQVGVAVNLPSLWDFLLIAIACLAAMMGVVSLVMHCMQIYRRRSLRRRVMNGEIDLETLGVKRLTVPQEILDQMPLYVFEESTAQDLAKGTVPEPGDVEMGSNDTHVETIATNSTSKTAYSQLTCAICLDDFKVNETQIREMPCKHIFHPECIDDFLLKNSSLCPLCKKNALPKHYCPAIITNSMVRRDRIYRSQHGHRPWYHFHRRGIAESIDLPAMSRPAHNEVGADVETDVAAPMPGTTTQTQSPPAPNDPLSHSSAPPPEELSSSLPRRSAPSGRRREWARQRALSLLGEPQPVSASHQSRSGPRPNALRRGWRTAFPGFQ